MILRTPERAALATLALSLLSLLVVAGISVVLSVTQLRTDDQVACNEEVISRIHVIERFVIEAESLGRAYLALGDPVLRDQYTATLALLDDEIRATRLLVSNQAVSPALLQELSDSVRRRFALLSLRLAQRGDVYRPPRETIGAGREEMNNLRELLDALKNEQFSRLARVRASRLTAIHAQWLVTALILVVAGLLAVLIYRKTRTINAIRAATERQALHLAHHDPLTGLLNRRALQQALEGCLARSGDAAVLYMDLDGFKVINDTCGHDVGDQLLVAVAGRVRATVRATDLVARMGGDEFIIVLPDAVRDEDAAMVAAKLIEAVARPYVVGELTLTLGGSVGVARHPRHGTTVKNLLIAADLALYEAKAAGRNCYRFASRSGLPDVTAAARATLA